MQKNEITLLKIKLVDYLNKEFARVSMIKIAEECNVHIKFHECAIKYNTH